MIDYANIGLGTYAFFWHHQQTMPDGSPGDPVGLDVMLRRTHELGVTRFQICDYAPIMTCTDAQLREVKALADDLGIVLELGSRGVVTGHLLTMLRIAGVLGATTIRSMLYGTGARPTLAEAEKLIMAALPAYAAAGTTLALETYEQVGTQDLVALVETIGSDQLGICLDPGNTVARLEHPRDVVHRCAPSTRNVHVKDFDFTRRDGWIGFTLAGTELGTGLLDVDDLLSSVSPAANDLSCIVEHWVPYQGSLAATLALETAWTAHAVAYLKEHDIP